MSTTIIRYKSNKGFEIHEDFMQLAFIYIYMELNKPGMYDGFTDKPGLMTNCLWRLDGDLGGIFTLGWEDCLNTLADEQLMVSLLEQVKITLQAKGVSIAAEEIAALPTEDEMFTLSHGSRPFRTSDLIRILDALIKMLQGNWGSETYFMKIIISD